MFNPNAAPTWAQVIGWLGYIAVVGPLFARRCGWLSLATPRKLPAAALPQQPAA